MSKMQLVQVAWETRNVLYTFYPGEEVFYFKCLV